MGGYSYSNYGYGSDDIAKVFGLAIGWVILILIVAIAIQIWCCVLAYRMAVERDQNGGLWVVLSLFIGWIAVIILACMRKPYSRDYRGIERNSSTSNALHESRQYSYAYKSHMSKPQTEGEKNTEGEWVCEHCGFKNPRTSTYCKSCYKKKN